MNPNDAASRRVWTKRASATAVEVPDSHVIFVSNAKAGADLIERAAS
jgi:hypothetical protein